MDNSHISHSKSASTPKLPFLDRIRKTIESFSLTDKIIFGIFVAVFVLSSLYIIDRVNRYFSIEVPIQGGTLVEGVVGNPRFINPVLSITDSGRDITALVYAGLMRVGQDGAIVPDLAQSYKISDDGKIYTFTLREKLEFHDGTPVTADDVVFTVKKTQDPAIKSPKRANWAGVTVQKIDDRTVQFTLAKPYAPFLENTTLGILPQNIWKNLSIEEFTYSELNTKPIGAGAYKFSAVQYNTTGIAQYYNLVPFKKYPLGSPYISHLIIKIYSNQKDLLAAFNRGDIDSLYDVFPQDIATITRSDAVIARAPYSRVIGTFFNQNQAPVLTNKEVRQALKLALDKETIIKAARSDYAVLIDDPIPPGSFPPIPPSSTSTATSSIEGARKILTDAGWAPDENGIMVKKTKTATQTLQFSISTADSQELVQAAQLISEAWKKIGADVDVKVFESGELNQNVIRPRRYDILLFGEIIGRDPDLYAFWHSSQRADPGLNIAEYVNLKADKMLETARSTSDTATRIDQYKKFQAEIRADIPAIFLYTPEFTYIMSNKLHGLKLTESITTPSERFTNVNRWYIDTDMVWKIFIKKSQ